MEHYYQNYLWYMYTSMCTHTKSIVERKNLQIKGCRAMLPDVLTNKKWIKWRKLGHVLTISLYLLITKAFTCEMFQCLVKCLYTIMWYMIEYVTYIFLRNVDSRNLTGIV